MAIISSTTSQLRVSIIKVFTSRPQKHIIDIYLSNGNHATNINWTDIHLSLTRTQATTLVTKLQKQLSKKEE